MSLIETDQKRSAGTQGSLVTLICDSGDRYSRTYCDDDWLTLRCLDLAPYLAHGDQPEPTLSTKFDFEIVTTDAIQFLLNDIC